MGPLPIKSALPKAQSFMRPKVECVFPISSEKENRIAYISVQYTNDMFGCREFGNGSGLEGPEILILCLGKLK